MRESSAEGLCGLVISSIRNLPAVIASQAKQSRLPPEIQSGLLLATLLAMTIPWLPPPELVTAKLAADLVEHSVDHAGLLAIDEGVGDVDIFGHDDAARHVLAMFQFVGPCPQHRAQDRFDALQRPALRQRLVDQRIELLLVAHDAGNDVAEERRFRREICIALDLVAEPVALELRKNVVDAGTTDIHLVQRLHGCEPRRTAPVRFLLRASRRLLVVIGHDQARASRRFMRSIAIAARAASPPLFSSLARARAQACASVLTVRMPLPSGSLRATARSISAREDSCETISKWMVSPRITQPSAIAASYGLPLAAAESIAMAIAAGISSAPGTVMTSWV